jgi:hypothetical protein
MAGAILGMIPQIIDTVSAAKQAKAANGGGAAANAGNSKQQPPRAAAGAAASGSGNAGQAAQMMQMFSQMMQQMMQMMRQMMTSRQGQPAAGAQTAPPPGQASSQPGQNPAAANGPPGAVMAAGQRPTGPSSNLPGSTGQITNSAVNQNQGTSVANAGLRNQLPTSTTGGASLAPQGPNGLVPAGASGSIQSLISNAATTPPTGLQGVTTGPARLDGGPSGNFGARGLASDIGISGVGGCRTGNCPPNNFGGLGSSSGPSFPPLTSSLVGFNPLGINSIGGGLPGSTANAGNSGGVSAGNGAIPPRSLMA